MKDVLDGRIMTESAALRPKIYSYLASHRDDDKKKQKAQKNLS